ncbi:hypothetical protein CXG81DRAFT_23094 [Caulochytrium protostelioides]|uniref:Pru domain-containing protein n=1 Tax=Caulochytrium protostelioides TaxID=1555241 RepID=A0A4V1IVJ9_9FUNG|nr:hypothetical protein CXG81DRAFT_23094 [Caulochytrium protostelioides]|eukprot:RKP04319.1 hypothetical protein CXG81DRAFT_23094 [Caulochytrium protostelioides]
MSRLTGSWGNSDLNSNLLEIKAGRCTQDGTTVTSEPARGLLWLSLSEDNIYSLHWKDRRTNVKDTELILFPQEAEMALVKQAEPARVLVLKFKSSSQRSFFWIQTKDEDKAKDAVFVSQFNYFLGHDHGSKDGLGRHQLDAADRANGREASTDPHDDMQRFFGLGGGNGAGAAAAGGAQRSPSPSRAPKETYTPAMLAPLLRYRDVIAMICPSLPETATPEDAARNEDFVELVGTLRAMGASPILEGLSQTERSIDEFLTAVRAIKVDAAAAPASSSSTAPSKDAPTDGSGGASGGSGAGAGAGDTMETD